MNVVAIETVLDERISAPEQRDGPAGCGVQRMDCPLNDRDADRAHVRIYETKRHGIGGEHRLNDFCVSNVLI